MGWQARDIPDQAGRVAVVTGATSGLGLEVARELARRRAIVIVAARDLVKGERVRATFLAEIPTATVEVRFLELSSLDAVRTFADTVLRDHPRIDLLVNDAGVMALPAALTADGFEWQMGVNHLGHFALTASLLPGLLARAGSRIVTVTSLLGLAGRPWHHDRLRLDLRYSPWLAYCDSKVANYRCAVELARRVERARVPSASIVAHPGLTLTAVQATAVQAGAAGTPGVLAEAASRWIGMRPPEGALSLLRAATDPSARNGETFGPRAGIRGTPIRLPRAVPWLRRQDVEGTWAACEAATGTDYSGLLG